MKNPSRTLRSFKDISAVERARSSPSSEPPAPVNSAPLRCATMLETMDSGELHLPGEKACMER